MGKVLIAILAVGWGLVLIPAGFRRRSERGNFSLLGLGASIAALATFTRRTQKQTQPIWSSDSMRSYAGGPVPPLGGFGLSAQQGQRRVSGSVRRQRQILLVLAALAVVTLLLAMVPGLRMLIAAHVAIDFVLAVYVVLLLRFKQTRPAPSAYSSASNEPTRLPWAS